LVNALLAVYPSQVTKEQLEDATDPEEIQQIVLEDAIRAYEAKEAELGADEATGVPVLREMERIVLLSIIDHAWREHLYEMDYLQEGIGLRAYGQRDPLVEYQREAFQMFQEMKDAIQEEFVRYIYRVQLIRQDEPARPRPQRVRLAQGGQAGKGQAEAVSGQASSDKTPRNAPCPCGSGKKYKKCHGLSA
jgi:preprotein translocase subunit SecA